MKPKKHILLFGILVFILSLPLNRACSEENLQNETLDFNSPNLTTVPVVNVFLYFF